jgi:uncharacterized protein (TIGR04255 family)
MARIRHLTNAPIVEAIVDFRVVTPPGFSVTGLRSVQPQLASDFPVMEEQFLFQAAVSINAAPGAAITSSTTSAPQLRGYVFKNGDGTSLAQFRHDGFTFNRLKPYTSWKEIRPQVVRLWHLYESVAQPSVQRVALRYINHIPIPSTGLELKTILQTPISIPRRGPDLVSEAFSRVVVRDMRADLWAAIVTAIQPTLLANTANLVVDIDAYRNVAGMRPTSGELDDLLDSLHNLKNSLFFGSITEATARKFD